MSNIVEQIEALNFEDLDKLVNALKRKPEKTPVQKLDERVNDLETKLEKSTKLLKSMESSIIVLVFTLFFFFYLSQAR